MEMFEGLEGANRFSTASSSKFRIAAVSAFNFAMLPALCTLEL